MPNDWKQRWQPVIDAIGTELSNGTTLGADAVELGTIRRYLEPLELDCALHYDAAVARAHGYSDIIAPYSSLLSFTLAAMWRPGDPPLFTDQARDAQPARSGLKMSYPAFFPTYSAFFATDFEMDYLRPATLGERLRRRGAKLVSCEPKETRVGRGAFVKTESRIETEDGEIIALSRGGSYLYEPHATVTA